MTEEQKKQLSDYENAKKMLAYAVDELSQVPLVLANYVALQNCIAFLTQLSSNVNGEHEKLLKNIKESAEAPASLDVDT